MNPGQECHFILAQAIHLMLMRQVTSSVNSALLYFQIFPNIILMRTNLDYILISCDINNVLLFHHLYQVQDLLSFEELGDKMLVSALQGLLHSGDEQLRLMAAVNRNFGLSPRTQKFILF